jgi:hypothetical protein
MTIAESLEDLTFPSTEVTREPSAPKVSECAGATAKDVGAYDEHAATKNVTAVHTATIFTRPGTQLILGQPSPS